MNRILCMVAVCMSIAFSGFAAPAEVSVRQADNPIPGQYVVVFNQDVENPGRLASSIAQSHSGVVGYVYASALKGFSVRTSEQMAVAIANNPNVAYVEQDSVVHLVATQSNATWGLDRSDQRELPLDGSYTYNTTASGVNAYIIDTGIRTTHSDFGGRAAHGYDAVDNDSDATDCNGHGTHVAGTVAGSTWGIAKGATLIAVRCSIAREVARSPV